jgi:outer membrane biosynthesis protein TonB
MVKIRSNHKEKFPLSIKDGRRVSYRDISPGEVIELEEHQISQDTYRLIGRGVLVLTKQEEDGKLVELKAPEPVPEPVISSPIIPDPPKEEVKEEEKVDREEKKEEPIEEVTTADERPSRKRRRKISEDKPSD